MEQFELKSCPFCGGKAVKGMYPEGVESGDVNCVECNATASIEKWNTRTSGWISVVSGVKAD